MEILLISMAEVTTTRFLHASDIHLGAKQYRNPMLADDHLYAFQQILNLGISKQVDFILLGGDVFTSQDILPNQMEQIIDTLTDFKNTTEGKLPLIAIEGNHDIRQYSHGNRIPRRQSWLRILNRKLTNFLGNVSCSYPRIKLLFNRYLVCI